MLVNPSTLKINLLLSQIKDKETVARNVPHKKRWYIGAVQIHVEPPPITLIKIKNDAKSEKYCVKIRFRRDPSSEKPDLYEFKMALSVNRET